MKSYNLRGTNGSGKTFVARELLRLTNAEPCLFFGKKVAAYKGLMFDQPFFLIGSYETQCGGCDTISSVAQVAELLRLLMTNNDDDAVFDHYSNSGIVFFEGLMISHMLGTVGAMQNRLGKNYNVLSFLDTPLETCIERVRRRRFERGDERPFDPRNIIKDHPRVASCMVNAVKAGYRVRTVEHENALQNVLNDLSDLSVPYGKL